MFKVASIVFPIDESLEFVEKKTRFQEYGYKGFYVSEIIEDGNSLVLFPWGQGGDDVCFDISSIWHKSHFRPLDYEEIKSISRKTEIDDKIADIERKIDAIIRNIDDLKILIQ